MAIREGNLTIFDGPNPFEDDEKDLFGGANPFEDEPEGEADLGPLREFAQTFNKRLAGVVGVPVALIDRALAEIGADGMNAGQDATPAVEKLFNKLGIRTDTSRDPGIMSKLGSNSADAAIQLGAIIAAGPGLAAKKGTDVASRVIRFIGELGTKNVGRTALSEAGAVTGATLGGETLKDTEVPSAVTGASVGGMVGGMVGKKALGTAIGGTIGLGVGGALDMAGVHTPGELFGNVVGGAVGGAGVNKVADTVRAPLSQLTRMMTPAHKAPLRPTAGSIDAPRQFAEDQIKGDLMKAEDEIRLAVEGVPRQGDPQDLSIKFRDRLDRADRVARRLEDRYWSRVPKDVTVSPRQLEDFAKVLEREARAGTDSALPKKQLAILKRWAAETRPEVDPDTGRMIRQGRPLTTGRLMALRSDILHASRADRVAASKGIKSVTKGLVRNYSRMAEAIEDAIGTAIPQNVPYTQAKAYSRARNDLYTRGPIGEILLYNPMGDAYVHPAETVQKLMTAYGSLGPDAVKRVATQGASARMGAALTKDFEDTIRASFREAVDAGPDSAKNAQVWINKNMPRLKVFSEAANDMNSAMQAVQNATVRRADIEASALAKYSQLDPQIAIKRVFSSPNPSKVADELVTSFRNDPDAIAGFKTGVIDELMDRTTFSGDKLVDALKHNSPMRGIFKAAFSPEELTRLERIAILAKDVESGEGFKLRRFATKGATIMARILGAQTGSFISHAGGGRGNIQVPAITSNLFRSVTEKALGIFKASDLVALAVRDPRWEKFLLSRAPGTLHEAKVLNKRIRRLVAGMEAGRMEILREVEDEDAD